MKNRALYQIIVRIFCALGKAERILLVALFAIAFGAAGMILWSRWLVISTVVPIQGGTYVEGLVASSPADVQPTLDVLTKVGLTTLDDANTVQPGLANNWEIQDNGKKYVFSLRPEADINVVRQAMQDSATRFRDVQVAVNDDRTVVFSLSQPLAPFLVSTATPIFPYGPFRVDTQDKGRIVLSRNPQSIVGAAYLDKLELKVYADSFRLTQALASGDIEGVADTSTVEKERLLSPLIKYDLILPRRTYVFFNLNKESLKDENVRQRLKAAKPLDSPISLTLVTLSSPRYEQYAQEIVEKWRPLGVTLTVETRTATDLAKEVVPYRAYDVLIYGLDFGADPDPYPFWHSSQIGETGLNLSNFANLDADKLLERARQEQDSAKRAELYGQFYELFDRLVPAFELERVSAQFAVSKSIKGVRTLEGLSVADRYRFITSWYKKEMRIRRDVAS